MKLRSSWLLLAAAVLCLAVVAAGCGSSSSSSSSSSSESSASEEQAPEETSSESSEPAAEGSAAVLSMNELYEGVGGAMPTSGPPAAKGKEVWWVSCGMAITPCAIPAHAAEKAAKALGWSFHIADGKGNENGGDLTALKTAIAAKPDGIIIHGISCPVIKAGLEEAKADEIPVMGVESLDCSEEGNGGEELFTAGMKYSEKAPTARDYFRAWGEVGASYLINATNEEAKLVEMEATEEGLQSVVYEAFNEVMEKCASCETLTKIPFTSSDYTPGGVLSQGFKASLVKYPEANSVYVFTEAAVEGGEAAKSLEAAGLSDKVTSCCGAGSGTLLNLIREGKWTAAAAHSAEWMGYGSMDDMNRVFNGEPTVPEGIGPVLVTKEKNLPSGSDEEYAPSFSIPAKYEELWKTGK